MSLKRTLERHIWPFHRSGPRKRFKDCLRAAEGQIADGHLEAAAGQALQLAELAGNEPAKLNRIGDVLVRAHRPDHAVTFFERVGRAYADEGFVAKAIAIYKKILRFDPRRRDVELMLETLYRRNGLPARLNGSGLPSPSGTGAGDRPQAAAPDPAAVAEKEKGAGRLLVVDDDETFCGFVDILLSEKGYQVVTETDTRRVLELLRGQTFDVLLLDLEMPQVHGLELLEQVREHWNVLPILIVTAHGGGDTTLEAMRRGATDFVIKPVDASHLDLRIRAACDLEHAKRLANTDGLTGLYNHRYLHQRLQQEIERGGRYARQLSLVMADIDNFKAYNDAFGHPRGDGILIAVAETLRQISRASDVIARYGGDEFVLILPETPAGEARVMAERARESVEALHRAGNGSITPGVTLSLGVASLSAGDGKHDLIDAADAALYEAKRLGRNRVCVAGENPSTNAAAAAVS